jgi:hypothetical protein
MPPVKTEVVSEGAKLTPGMLKRSLPLLQLTFHPRCKVSIEPDVRDPHRSAEEYKKANGSSKHIADLRVGTIPYRQASVAVALNFAVPYDTQAGCLASKIVMPGIS